ncbi:hypothetical protein [Tenacibaculum sp. MAR_2009_124]|uniref:hypothetical protein n=1 Tax=Tenacibaculum sp. MAR_2009_124 TaxID=1250059 RepID=UPI00115F8B7F|nr:hypothetical protein [Tenacibaculum sp. MAR_2009_124]
MYKNTLLILLLFGAFTVFGATSVVRKITPNTNISINYFENSEGIQLNEVEGPMEHYTNSEEG